MGRVTIHPDKPNAVFFNPHRSIDKSFSLELDDKDISFFMICPVRCLIVVFKPIVD